MTNMMVLSGGLIVMLLTATCISELWYFIRGRDHQSKPTAQPKGD